MQQSSIGVPQEKWGAKRGAVSCLQQYTIQRQDVQVDRLHTNSWRLVKVTHKVICITTNICLSKKKWCYLRWFIIYPGILNFTVKEQCKLYCQADGYNFFYALSDEVKDGTPCNDHSSDICVHGKCQVKIWSWILNKYISYNCWRRISINTKSFWFSMWAATTLWDPLPLKTSVGCVWEITPPVMCLRAISRNNPGEIVRNI